MSLTEPRYNARPFIGERLAGGSRSVVYASAGNTVVKVPNPGTPDSWIRAEAIYCDAAVAAGAPAPRVLETVRLNSEHTVRFERVAGRPMWDHVADNPSTASANGATLAQVQIDLQTKPVPIVLPEMRSRLLAKLHLAAAVLREHRLGVVQLLESAWSDAKPMSLCHGDLHLKNVLMSPDGPVLVDWFDASRGPWIADVARTSLLLDMALGTSGPGPEWLPALRLGYLARISREPAFEESAFRRWRVIGLAARLSEGLHVELTLDLLERELASLPLTRT